MLAVKRLKMKEPGFVAYALWAKEVRKTLMNAYPNYSKFLSINFYHIINALNNLSSFNKNKSTT